MKIPKKKVVQVKLSVRVSEERYEELTGAAAAQAWSVNAEINHRLAAGPILEQLRALTAEVKHLRAIIDEQKST